jgi:ribonuclease HII
LKITKRLRIPKTLQEEYLIGLGWAEPRRKNKGYQKIAGLDEVGRGSWAGPIVAACVILPQNKRLYSLRDSKLLNEKEREKLALKIKKNCRYGIGRAEVWEINQLGISASLDLAYSRAIKNLKAKADFISERNALFFRTGMQASFSEERDTVGFSPRSVILIDGLGWKQAPLPSIAIKGGDMTCASIAAASIVAKVYRDNLMRKLSKKYPKWRFDQHKGYGTKLHQDLIKKYGICAIHRINYKSIKPFCAK